MNTLPRHVGRAAIIAVLVVFSMLVVLTALGWMPPTGHRSASDLRDDPLVAPERLGGFPRWYGMADGEISDAKQLGRQYHAAAIEAAYLPPGLDPVLASAVRAHNRETLRGWAPYGRNGRVRCSSAGLFVECTRTGRQLTVDVLASKSMDEAVVAALVEEFWAAQRLGRPTPTSSAAATSGTPSPG